MIVDPNLVDAVKDAMAYTEGKCSRCEHFAKARVGNSTRIYPVCGLNPAAVFRVSPSGSCKHFTLSSRLSQKS